MPLPVEAVLSGLLAALRERSNAVLVAPPGAGKTTMVAPALLDEPWCTGQVWLLSPRRLAARAAAERIADRLGEAPGDSVGYITRLDSRQSARTRLLVVTQGVFLRRIQDDPALEGVSAVLFDEVHERSLDGDFALALALDAQQGFREDLRLIAMSATLDGARFSALMGNAPVVESDGRAFPIEYRHIGRDPAARIEDAMASAVVRALMDEGEGDILAFLPGVGEIERTAERLAGREAAIAVHRLHGSLEPAQQRAALQPARDGRRKVILATSIAETSLTIDGVRIVVDSGLARRPVHDVAAGLTRLETRRVSQAAAIQRAGRAGRQAPGIAYRLWDAAASGGFPAHDEPEIQASDLSSLRLDCAIWGVNDPAGLPWIDAPPAAAWREAERRLKVIAALDEEGRATAHGKAIAALPLDPRLAHMLVLAGARGMAAVAAEVALLLTERGLGGNDADLTQRLARWRREKGQRADAARGMARRWSALASGQDGVEQKSESDPGEAVALCLALAFPDRIARRRQADGEDWLSAGGRAFRLDVASPLARGEWLAVGEVQGTPSGARILSAAPIDPAAVERLFADRIAERRTVRWRSDGDGVETLRERVIGAIRLSSGPDDSPDRAAVLAALTEGLGRAGLDSLPWDAGAQALRVRAAYAGEDALSDAALLADVEEWLPDVLPDKARRLSAIPPIALRQMLENRLGWDAMRRIDRIAPRQFVSPAGSHHDIDYGAEGGPKVELRVQALFGLSQHPVVGEGERALPLVLSLTSPAGRPIQTTRDLPAFWTGSWTEVAKEMRGRYPRHPWPDDPASASATLRTKKADSRGKA